MSEQLDRIEQKLDTLRAFLAPRPCKPEDHNHTHADDAFSFRMLLPDEEPYDNCYIILGDRTTRRIKDL